MIFFLSVESWTAPKDGYACGSWEEFGIIAYPYWFYGQSIKQSSDVGHSLGLCFRKAVFSVGVQPWRKCTGTQKCMKCHQNSVPSEPPRAQSCRELVRHPGSSPCCSLMLKCKWYCPKANPINKGFVNILVGWHWLWPCQAVARAGVWFHGSDWESRADCHHFHHWHSEMLSQSGLASLWSIK